MPAKYINNTLFVGFIDIRKVAILHSNILNLTLNKKISGPIQPKKLVEK